MLNLAYSLLLATVGLWAVYLPMAWYWNERLFFGLMIKEGKSRQYWLKFFPAFLKRELKAAFAFFIFLIVIAIIESIMGRDR